MHTSIVNSILPSQTHLFPARDIDDSIGCINTSQSCDGNYREVSEDEPCDCWICIHFGTLESDKLMGDYVLLNRTDMLDGNFEQQLLAL